MVCFPAIAEDDKTWVLKGELGLEVTRRGEALHPERQPLATLDRIRRTIGEYPRALRPGGRRPIPAGSVAAGRRHGQGIVVPQLRAKRAAPTNSTALCSAANAVPKAAGVAHPIDPHRD